MNINLQNNYEQVHARLLSHKRHLLSHQKLISKYQEKIKRLKFQGYIENVNLDQDYISGRVWYLSHFSTMQEVSSLS